MPPLPFSREISIFLQSHGYIPVLHSGKIAENLPGGYLKIEDSCGLEPHMRRLAPSACLLLSYVCPQCSYHRSMLTSFFFLANLFGALPCLRLWHCVHRLTRLSSSSPSSGCSFSSWIWCTSSALHIFLSLPISCVPDAAASFILLRQSWHS